jgi:hypothetical protein
MSWNLSAHSYCFELKHVTQKSTFDKLLNHLAEDIWMNFMKDDSAPEHFADLDIPENREEGIPFIANELNNYIIEFNCTDKGASFVVYSEYDTSERWDSELVDSIANFFLLNSDQDYCLGQYAAFDKTGGYAHQWITIKEGEQTHAMNMNKFMDLLSKSRNYSFPSIKEIKAFEDNHQLGSSTLPVGLA